MKKRSVFILVLCMALSIFAGCSESGSGATIITTGPDDDDIKIIDAPIRETEPTAPPLRDSGALGEYEVTINGFELTQDFQGGPAIVIHFTFTNNAKESQSAMFALSRKAFQNGVGLEDATFRDDGIHNSSDLMKKIQPGTTIELTEAYKLSSETAPVEFYLSKAISFDDIKVGKVYELAPGEENILSVAPGVDSAVEIGRYLISINSYKIAEDYKGNLALILNMGYTNNSDVDSPFYAAVEVTAYQDGIELETAHFTDESVMDNDSNYLNVLPGAGVGVAEAFILTSETSPVEIEITPMFSFDGEKIVTQIDIAE